MVWSKNDDNCDSHPKVARLSHISYRLWVMGRNYSCLHLTDGHLDQAALQLLRGMARVSDDEMRASVVELLHVPMNYKVGLWEKNGDGYEVHDFLEFNPSRAKVLLERKRKQEAGRKGGRKSAESKRLIAGAVVGASDVLAEGGNTRPDPPPTEVGGGEGAWPEGAAPSIEERLRAIGFSDDGQVASFLSEDPGPLVAALQAAESAEHDKLKAFWAVLRSPPSQRGIAG